MELEKVIPRADVVVLAEIISNTGTIDEQAGFDGRKSIRSSYDIRFRVINKVKGKAPGEVMTSYEVLAVQGMWMYCSGSGLEEVMKPGERYVLLLEFRGDKLHLLRAEKTTELAKIKGLLRKQDKSLKGTAGKRNGEKY